MFGNSQNGLEYLQNFLEKPQVSWVFFGNGEGAPNCLEFTSEHLETPKLPGPWAGPGPPAFTLGSHLAHILTKIQWFQKVGLDSKLIFLCGKFQAFFLSGLCHDLFLCHENVLEFCHGENVGTIKMQCSPPFCKLIPPPSIKCAAPSRPPLHFTYLVPPLF